MTALPPVPVRAMSTSPPHPADAVPGARADAAKAQVEATGYRRAQAPEWLLDVLACLVGLAAFVAVWGLIAKYGGRIPDPVTVWSAAGEIFAHPFYSKGPNRTGMRSEVLSSLVRVGIAWPPRALIGAHLV